MKKAIFCILFCFACALAQGVVYQASEADPPKIQSHAAVSFLPAQTPAGNAAMAITAQGTSEHAFVGFRLRGNELSTASELRLEFYLNLSSLEALDRNARMKVVLRLRDAENNPIEPANSATARLRLSDIYAGQVAERIHKTIDTSLRVEASESVQGSDWVYVVATFGGLPSSMARAHLLFQLDTEAVGTVYLADFKATVR